MLKPRPHAKYFSRREALAIAESAYQSGVARGEQKEKDIYWSGNATAHGSDAQSFTQWRENNYPNLPDNISNTSNV